jgi:tRNA (cytidine/uridine-2'-O-)-methyltransferase
MFHVVLFEPEIPPNTGNILRLCANTGSTLHLVRPLGFSLQDRQLARAGLDYAEFANVRVHDCWMDCRDTLAGRRLFAVSTRGTVRYDRVRYQADDVLIFGPETRGLPAALLSVIGSGNCLRIPMANGNRSLNLSNAAAVVLYEAWRQLAFAEASESAGP